MLAIKRSDRQYQSPGHERHPIKYKTANHLEVTTGLPRPYVNSNFWLYLSETTGYLYQFVLVVRLPQSLFISIYFYTASASFIHLQLLVIFTGDKPFDMQHSWS